MFPLSDGFGGNPIFSNIVIFPENKSQQEKAGKMKDKIGKVSSLEKVYEMGTGDFPAIHLPFFPFCFLLFSFFSNRREKEREKWLLIGR